MKVMILAAGKGERLLPLTSSIPKPLIPINNKPILQHTIEILKKNGYEEFVINVSYLKDQIMNYLGNGEKFGVSITYSEENTPLETGGGIKKALPFLGDNPFLLVNGDILTDYPLKQLQRCYTTRSAHLVLVPKATHTSPDDFAINTEKRLSIQGTPKYTYSGIAVLNPTLFENFTEEKFKLYDVFINTLNKNELTGEVYPGYWTDLGTFDRINKANLHFKAHAKGETNGLG